MLARLTIATKSETKHLKNLSLRKERRDFCLGVYRRISLARTHQRLLDMRAKNSSGL